MYIKKLSIIAAGIFLFAAVMYAQEQPLRIPPSDATNPATFLNALIRADSTATGGIPENRVYVLDRNAIYIHNAILTVNSGQAIRIRAADGEGEKPVIYLYDAGTGTGRPPGNMIVLNGGDLELKNICIAGYFELEPEGLDGVQGGLINTTGAGSNIYIDGVIFSNINGQHIRTGFDVGTVSVKNTIFSNMGALTTSNLGAGKGFDFREAEIDTFILENCTFVNYQDRPIRHYNFNNPNPDTGGTRILHYADINHNTFINGMGYHGLFSLGNVGEQINITNNLFVDAFALGEDPTDTTRQAEWANTGEKYSNGRNRITWIFTAQNNITDWNVDNNYFVISDSGQAFLDDYGFSPGSQLSWHINSRLGADSVNAFTQADLSLANTPALMTNMMRWYETPDAEGGAGKTKLVNNFNKELYDYDRRVIQYFRDTLDASYSTASPVYTGGENSYPAGDLNWFPDKKAQWEAGVVPFTTVIDGNKDEFYNSLTGPADGYLQLRSFVQSTTGRAVNDDDLSAKIWTSWSDEWFYLYMEVKDDTLSGNAANVWDVDEIELKIDPIPDDSTETGNTMFEARLTALSLADGATVQDSLNNITAANKQYTRKITSDGYVLEFGIKWAVMRSTNGETITPAPGTEIGMAINVHDNDAARRQATIMWGAVLNDAAYQTPKYLGTVTLLDGNKMMFVAQNKMTGHLNPLPYDGSNEPGVSVEQMPNIPKDYSLSQNYPNPFNPSTVIEFGIPKQSQVQVSVFNLLGEKVAELVNEELQPGFYKTSFNASSLPSGIYFYRIEAGTFMQAKKLSLVK